MKELYEDVHDGFVRSVEALYEENDIQISPVLKESADRFCNDVRLRKIDGVSSVAEADIYTSAAFYSWIFAYGGAISAVSPLKVIDEYKKQFFQWLFLLRFFLCKPLSIFRCL